MLTEVDQLQLTFPEGKVRRSRFADFLEFYRTHPEVYDQFLKKTREAKQKRRSGVGSRMIWELVRWELWEMARNLNNNHAPYYSRLVMERNKDLQGIFQIRDKNFDTKLEALVREADRIDLERVNHE